MITSLYLLSSTGSAHLGYSRLVFNYFFLNKTSIGSLRRKSYVNFCKQISHHFSIFAPIMVLRNRTILETFFSECPQGMTAVWNADVNEEKTRWKILFFYQFLTQMTENFHQKVGILLTIVACANFQNEWKILRYWGMIGCQHFSRFFNSKTLQTFYKVHSN